MNQLTLSLLGLDFLFNVPYHYWFLVYIFAVVLFCSSMQSWAKGKLNEIPLSCAYYISSILCLFADDYITMFISMESMVIFAALLLLMKNCRAAYLYFFVHFIGASFILIGMSYVITKNPRMLNFVELIHGDTADYFYYFCILFGLMINAAIFPFSWWMPACYSRASDSSFVLLTSFTTKVSIFVILKLCAGLYWLEIFGFCSLVYALFYGIRENNVRKIFCYLSIIQAGFIILIVANGEYREFVTESIGIHILYNALLGTCLMILESEYNISLISEITKITDKWVNIALITSSLMLINFPMFASFISKTVIAKSILSDTLYCFMVIMNIAVFLFLPLRFYSGNRITKFQKIHNNYLVIIGILITNIVLANILVFWKYYHVISLMDVLKQILIIIVGVIIGYKFNIERKELYHNTLISKFFQNFIRLYNKVEGSFRRLKMPRINNKYRLKWSAVISLHNQRTGIFMIFGVLVLMLIMLTSCSKEEEKMLAPIASKSSNPNDVYDWLRDKDWPVKIDNKNILDYVEAENKYADHFFKNYKTEKKAIFDELKGRIQLDDTSVPIKKDNYYYYVQEKDGKEYPIYCRKMGSLESKEEVLLDVNKLASAQSFTQVGGLAMSKDQNLMTYSVDFSGDEQYSIKTFDISKQTYIQDEIHGVSSQIVWHRKLNGFFYLPFNEELRLDTVKFHKLGSDKSDDITVLKIEDPLYQLSIDSSNSEDYIFISMGGHGNNQVYFLDINNQDFEPKLIMPKQENIFYEVEHHGDYFYILTNLEAENFRILKYPIRENTNSFETFIPNEKDKYLKSFDITKNYIILNYKCNGLPKIQVIDLNSKKDRTLEFPDVSFVANAYSTNFQEDDIRIEYSSLARPNTTYGYDFLQDKLSILKTQNIPSGFNPEEYKVERILADNNGVKIPITLLYKKSLFKADGSNPLYLYGYGSYGIAAPIGFRNTAITYANRGFVYAVAHIRGGDDLGHTWYEAAKFLNKKRTFEDFIKSAEYLIDKQYTSKGNIVICGGSAGGMLIGVAINERPELFKAAVAHVPFVDVLNTMLDETLPLTPGEFKEWGNPKENVYYEYIKSYSPYDNVKSHIYPAMFVTAGISDPRVGYWEAAKWVAKLRDMKTDNNLLLLKTNMDSGHKGASGRFDYLNEIAEEVVFVMYTLNAN